jgi:ABC-2 type transport system ATP-binding protein
MQAIEIKAMSKTYKGRKGREVEALKEISLSVGKGEVFGFLGPNGAGKSTTIKCLLGLINPTSGNATIMGKEISDADARKTVGFLPENPTFYDYLSAEEYLIFVGKVFKMPKDVLFSRTEEILKLLELWDSRKRQMRDYSKGMVQRVGLAQALLHDPDVYILDEPMSGLDPIGRALVKEIILDLKKRGKCVFFSTHITDDVEKVCDRVAVINKGQLLVVDSVVSILHRGVLGYSVFLTTQDGHTIEQFVEKADLQSFIQQSIGNKQLIEKIEPCSKDMEAFFLEIVAK